MRTVDNINFSFLHGRMLCKITANQFTIPRPFKFRIGCSMYTDKSFTLTDKALKICFLLIIKQISSGAQKNDRSKLMQAIYAKIACIFGMHRCDSLLLKDFLYCFHAFWNTLMPKTCCFSKNQHPFLTIRGNYLSKKKKIYK